MSAIRFFVSWILSSLLMFCASYLWHGVFLTDFSRINYPIGFFLTVASFVYLLFGFIISKGYSLIIFNKISGKKILKGLLIGMVTGVAVFSITLVAGVSFSYQLTMENLLLDLTWQIFEQSIGGVAVGLVHVLLVGEFVYQDD